jgi:hypothetical protein
LGIAVRRLVHALIESKPMVACKEVRIDELGWDARLLAR